MAAQPFSMDSMPEDVIGYILLRIPDEDVLAPMAAVCRTWRRLLSDEEFPRRHRQLHTLPRVLGLVHSVREAEEDCARFCPITDFVPATTDHIDMDALDARHGRVLLHSMYSDKAEGKMVVWNPVADSKTEIAPPKFCYSSGWSASVFCVDLDCDHFNCCHGGQFGVAFVGKSNDGLVSASVYLSDIEEWSAPVAADLGEISIAPKPAALVGNQLFMITQASRGVVVEYCIQENERSLRIISPPSSTISRYTDCIVTPGACDSVQFVALIRSTLRIWTKEVDRRGTAPWVPMKSIDLWTKLPALSPFCIESQLVGFGGSRLIFFSTREGLFQIDVSSREVREVSKTHRGCTLVPFTGS